MDSNVASTNKLSIKKNMLIFGIGVFCTKIINLFFSSIYSRYLTSAQFGIIDIISTICYLLIPICTFALAESVIKYGIDDNSNLKKVFSSSAAVYFFSLILISAFVLIGGQFIYGEYKYSALIYFLMECIFLFLQAFAQARKDTFGYSLSSIIYSIVSVTMICLFLIPLKLDINGYFYGLAIGVFIANIFLLFRNKIFSYFSFKAIDKEVLKTMLRYSLPLVLSNVSYWILGASDKFITKILLGEEYNGYLSVIHKIPTICTLLYSIFNYAYTLSALKDHKLSDTTKEEDERFYSQLFDKVLILLIIGCIGIALFSQFIIMLFQSSYHKYWIYIPLYTFGVVLNSLRNYFISIYCTKEKTLKIMIVVLIGAFIDIIVCYCLMKFTTMGLLAASIATVAGNGFMFIYYYFDSKKYVNIRIKAKSYISLFLAFAVCLLPLAKLPNWLFLSIAGVVFLFALWLNYKELISIAKLVLHKKKQLE